ncbi:MAG: zf-TFIIB domain-containing protein [Motiliproteus sp.]|nr:zf-TFIIB domain-containing protein [Motiliproteus sp.]MCW9052555.1 zf-TFIIB domain-containing protein [Motiliproteus sp.]
MLCPRCQKNLQMSDRQGVEIDYCPSCRGVWLDQGELDKIIERCNRLEQGQYQDQGYRPQPEYKQQKDSYRAEHHAHPRRRHSGSPYRYKKKKGMMEQLFDIFD